MAWKFYLMSTFGERLKTLRGGTSQAELAELLNLKQTTLSNYERSRNEPTFEVLRLICSHFGVNLEWLVFGSGPMRPEEAQTTHSLPEHTPAPAPQAACPRCAELEEELKTERGERRELAAENRQLWRENGELKERVARLEARIDRRAETPVEASLFDERPPIPSSSQATPPADKPA